MSAQQIESGSSPYAQEGYVQSAQVALGRIDTVEVNGKLLPFRAREVGTHVTENSVELDTQIPEYWRPLAPDAATPTWTDEQLDRAF